MSPLAWLVVGWVAPSPEPSALPTDEAPPAAPAAEAEAAPPPAAAEPSPASEAPAATPDAEGAPTEATVTAAPAQAEETPAAEADETPVPAEAPPGPATARGDHGGPPLPPAPPPEPIPSGPVRPGRGRLWIDIDLGIVAPVGGTRPARGRVVSGTAGVTFGLRLRPWIGLTTGFATWVHDLDTRSVVSVEGERLDELDLARMTAFDLLAVRAMLPIWRRVEPWAELGGTVGPYRPPFAARAEAAGGIRASLGLDAWLGSAFTLGVDLGYRGIWVDGALGHALQPLIRLGVHH